MSNSLSAEQSKLLANFKREVTDRASEIDPSSEENWFSLTLGWAIAKGLTPEAANEFACLVRYNTNPG